MGRVECVTCHVPESQEVVGDAIVGWGRSVVFGGRRLMGYVMARGFVGASMSVKPG